jgi:hypothetical protein
MWKRVIAIGVHVILLFSVYLLLRKVEGKERFPSEDVLYQTWDVRFYIDIAQRGYSWHENEQSNVAFFPAFPYIWRYTGASPYGISALNVLFFGAGVLLLASAMNFSPREIMLSLSMPSLMFMYVPYSEALFFFFSALALHGYLARQSDTNAKAESATGHRMLAVTTSERLTGVGLLLSSLTRSASSVFLPAILLTEWLAEDGTARRASLFGLATTAGVCLAAFIQYQYTGNWLGFVKAQRSWGVHLQWPQLPLSTWGGRTYLDSSALIAGLLSAGVLSRLAWRRVCCGERRHNQALVFSLAYLSAITVLALLLAVAKSTA